MVDTWSSSSRLDDEDRLPKPKPNSASLGTNEEVTKQLDIFVPSLAPKFALAARAAASLAVVAVVVVATVALVVIGPSPFSVPAMTSAEQPVARPAEGPGVGLAAPQLSGSQQPVARPVSVLAAAFA
eukprot:6183404-Pleurochrysis_carterae.AAC.1